MAACKRLLSSRITRLARAAVAATQIMPTGRNTTSIVIRKRSPPSLVSAGAAGGCIRKKIAEASSHTALRAIATISILEMALCSGRV